MEKNIEKIYATCDTHTKNGNCVWLDDFDDSINLNMFIMDIFLELFPKDGILTSVSAKKLNLAIINFLNQIDYRDGHLMLKYVSNLSNKLIDAYKD